MDVSSDDGILKIDRMTPPSYPYIFEYESATEVTVEAVPAFGHVFDSWSGDLSGSTNPITLTVDCNLDITANFSFNWYLIGGTGGGLVLVGFAIFFLIIKPRAG